MHIRISIPMQTLELYTAQGELLSRHRVSTALLGTGEQSGSFKTPCGRHVIRACIGAGQPVNTVFVRRRPTGEIWSPALAEANPERDWILTRILWLSGCEPGINRLGSVDTMRRFIYIHGTPDSTPLGVPGSHGCIRMSNADIVELFERVVAGTSVNIVEYSIEHNHWQAVAEMARQVRESVFINEQHVPPALEWDEFDAMSHQVIARNAHGLPIGTGRLLPDGHLGRMAVLPEWRGHGVGSAIFERLLELARRYRMRKLVLHAQTHAAGFYLRYGFVAVGEVFMEAGILHVRMECMLDKQGVDTRGDTIENREWM